MHHPLPSFAIAAVLATGLSALQGTPILAAGLLEAVEGVPQNAVGDTSELVVRRIWAPTGGAAPMGTVSADGRYLSYTDWSTGDVAVLDLMTMEKRRLTDSPFMTGTTGFAESSTISPDAKEIAYSWWNGSTHYELRLITLNGGEPRVLYGNPEVRWLKPSAWSPDGTQIAALMSRADGASQIALISVADGSTRVLKSLTDWRLPRSLTFSPDGSQIAYSFAPESDPRQNDIFILAADGSRERIAVEHPANDALFGWTPDGEALLFGSDRSGVFGLWAIRMADGRPKGAPILLKPELWGASNPLGITADGSLYFVVTTGRREVYTATLSPEHDALLGEPTAVGGQYLLDGQAPAWSADGQNLAFIVRSQPAAPWGIGAQRIVVRSTATGDTREIVPQLTNLHALRWAPDGRSFFLRGGDKGRGGYFRVDGYTGVAAPLMYGMVGGVNWSRDGKTIFYNTRGPSAGVLARDIESGETRELYVIPRGSSPLRSMALSPDEQRLALIPAGRDALQLMPVTGGPPEDLLHAEQGHFWSVRWTPDGEHLLVTMADDPGGLFPGGLFGLWKVPLDGTAGVKIGLELPNMFWGPRLHPDGRQITYVSGEHSAEVWVVENLSSVLGSKPTAASGR